MDIIRDEWVDLMTDCWRSDDAALRHSRQHCIDQYGVNFVQETLPDLLREDGLSEEDVIRLTCYGPDMEPPPLRPDWICLRQRGIERPEWATRDNGYDSDTHSENSEDWETADEDEA